MDWQPQVATFMREVKGLELPTRPTIADFLQGSLCIALMQEELQEVVEAMQEPDIEHLAKELADLLYVTLYTANAYGLIMEPIFAEVQRSNMTKKGGPIRLDGKQLKPDSYDPPDIARIVLAQREYQ